jgi:hypothetical protein
MAGMNARLNAEVETIFLMAADRYQFISSRFVKEIGRLGGDVGHFVSPYVKGRLESRFKDMIETGGARIRRKARRAAKRRGSRR